MPTPGRQCPGRHRLPEDRTRTRGASWRRAGGVADRVSGSGGEGPEILVPPVRPAPQVLEQLDVDTGRHVGHSEESQRAPVQQMVALEHHGRREPRVRLEQRYHELESEHGVAPDLDSFPLPLFLSVSPGPFEDPVCEAFQK